MKYAKNTPEIRKYLEEKGFIGLSFFQGKEFIYAFLTTRANFYNEWKEKNYATFNEKDNDIMPFLDKHISTDSQFKNFIDNLIKTMEKPIEKRPVGRPKSGKKKYLISVFPEFWEDVREYIRKKNETKP